MQKRQDRANPDRGIRWTKNQNPGHATQLYLHSSSFHRSSGEAFCIKGVSKRIVATTSSDGKEFSSFSPASTTRLATGKKPRKKKKWKLGTSPFRSFGFTLPSVQDDRAPDNRKASFPACEAEAVPQCQFAAGPCDPNACRIHAGKAPVSGNPSTKTLQCFQTDRKLASLDAMIPKSSQMATLFRSTETVRHRHVLIAPSICADALCAGEVLGRRGELASSRGATWTALTPFTSDAPMINSWARRIP
jgi:hypothetical protein